MNDARATSVALEIIRKVANTSGAGSSSGSSTVQGVSPTIGGNVVVCIMAN
jgi:hypothetical protein